MSALDGLRACAGRWRGENQLQDPHTNAPQVSPSTMTITPILADSFVRIDYTWRYEDDPQEGSMLVGYRPEAGVVTTHWIDTWHMGAKVMACRGEADSGGEISVRGSYAAPPGPDWGWRIVITPDAGEVLRMVMFNVSPDGKEELAVESYYTPA